MKSLIPLVGEKGKGLMMVVSPEDFEYLNQMSWYVGVNGYAMSGYGNYAHTHVVSRVFGRRPGGNEVVDHVNRDPRDNRRENLRIITRQQNSYNSLGRKQRVSLYKGIVRPKPNSRNGYWASLKVKPEKHRLGPFETQEQAAKAYDYFCRLHIPEYALLNFPDEVWSLEEIKTWIMPKNPKAVKPIPFSRTRGGGGFRGVIPFATKWKARLKYQGISTVGPARDTPEEAARDYDVMLMERWGDTRRLNFPPTT